VPRFGQEDMPSSTKFDLQCKQFFLSFINSFQLVAQEKTLRVDENENEQKNIKMQKKNIYIYIHIKEKNRENELNYLCHT
jgi:hypothetical protein